MKTAFVDLQRLTSRIEKNNVSKPDKTKFDKYVKISGIN